MLIAQDCEGRSQMDLEIRFTLKTCKQDYDSSSYKDEVIGAMDWPTSFLYLKGVEQISDIMSGSIAPPCTID